ncbi:MAG TPA: G/U mismatch-specific DNA glycosylase [Chloroflexota bacterium]|nr:G/U mismatch-specific DNA glycosylase [Chloroflexota bacterium]
MPETPWKPTKEQVLASARRTVEDVVAPNLKVLFVGINPGLYTAAIGHHFGRPGNRFWPVLHKAGFTPRQLSPFEERELLPLGYGITNFVARATAAAGELSTAEVREGASLLEAKIRRLTPRFVAFLGMQSYRVAFARPNAGVGLQPETIGDSKLWLLPNPSGLQAHYPLPELVRLFAELRRASSCS